MINWFIITATLCLIGMCTVHFWWGPLQRLSTPRIRVWFGLLAVYLVCIASATVLMLTGWAE